MLKETLEEKISHDHPVTTLSPQESADTTSSTHSLPPSIESTKKDLHQHAIICINVIPGSKRTSAFTPIFSSENFANSREHFSTTCTERILTQKNEALKNTALNPAFKVTSNAPLSASLTIETAPIRAEKDHPSISYLSQGTQTDSIEYSSIVLNERIQALQAQLAERDKTQGKLLALIRPPTRINSYQRLSRLLHADCTESAPINMQRRLRKRLNTTLGTAL